MSLRTLISVIFFVAAADASATVFNCGKVHLKASSGPGYVIIRDGVPFFFPKSVGHRGSRSIYTGTIEGKTVELEVPSLKEHFSIQLDGKVLKCAFIGEAGRPRK